MRIFSLVVCGMALLVLASGAFAQPDSLWSRTFGGSDQEECWSVQQTANGGYILGGTTRAFIYGRDFWLVKTGVDPTVAEPLFGAMPEKYALRQNYPNPFNPTTRITFDLTQTGHVSLKVFDLLGREVATLVDDVRAVGSHAVMFDGSGLASGIYLCCLQVGEWSQTRKMVLLK